MVRLLLIACFLFFAVPVFCQSYINLSQNKVRQKLDNYLLKFDIKGDISETDSSTILSITDTRRKPASFLFLYSDGKCVEENKLACDSCVTKYLEETLADKKMEWRKMNDTTYLSKYSKHLMMIITVNGTASSLIIRKTNWDKKAYKAIVTSL
jgi:hypothetical protein